jgi:hypothetical protein
MTRLPPINAIFIGFGADLLKLQLLNVPSINQYKSVIKYSTINILYSLLKHFITESHFRYE